MAATDTVKELSEKLHLASLTTGTQGKEVDFRGKGLKLDTEKDASSIVEAISHCPELESLCLEGNTLGQDAAKAIGKALEGRPKLKRALWKDMFTGRLKDEIPDALMFLSGGMMLSGAMLTELDLSDNAFGPVGAEALVPLLSSPCCFSLKVLRLNNNGLGPGGSEMVAKALSTSLSESRKRGTPLALKTLICGRNRLEDVGATAMGALIGEMGSLEELSLPQNGIFHNGVTALARGLACNRSLRVLNLNDNIVTLKGAAPLAKALEQLDQLEVLNLGDCLVKTAGAKALSRAIRNGHSSLKEVNLGYNDINLSGGLAIVEALRDKPLLELLELDGNKFGTTGVNQLEAAMETAGKIDKLCAFSDDEGSSADGDEDEEEENESAGEDDTSKDEICTVEAFLATPSASHLLKLGNQRCEQLLQAVEMSSDKSSRLEGYLDTFMKVSSVVGSKEEGEAGKKVALECGDALMQAAFAYATKESCIPELSNDLLVRLGLIKAERGKESNWPESSREGALTLLTELVPKNYFSSFLRECLQAFLSKPQHQRAHGGPVPAGKARHRLMQVLYQA